MERDDYAFGAIFLLVVACLSAAANIKIGTIDRNGAVAAAIDASYAQVAGVTKLREIDSDGPPFSLCVESTVPLNIQRIAAEFNDTLIRPIPLAACSSKIGEGFGMFSSVIRYFDASGNDAGHVRVEKIECESSTRCAVDLAFLSHSTRYMVRLIGGEWIFDSERLLRIV